MSLDSVNIRINNAEKNLIRSINENSRSIRNVEDTGDSHSTYLSNIDVAVNSIDNKITTGNAFTEESLQQVLCYGEVTSGPGIGQLHPIHITNSGDVEVEIADFVKGQNLMESSFPVVIASDQTNLNTKLIAEDYMGTDTNVRVDTNGKLVVQVDGVRTNGSETIAILDGTTGTSSEIQMGSHTRIAFYGDTDNTTNTNIFIEYSQDGVNWFRGAGDNAKIIVVGSSGNFYDEEHITPPRVRLSRPNSSGANETLELKYTLL